MRSLLIEEGEKEGLREAARRDDGIQIQDEAMKGGSSPRAHICMI